MKSHWPSSLAVLASIVSKKGRLVKKSAPPIEEFGKIMDCRKKQGCAKTERFDWNKINESYRKAIIFSHSNKFQTSAREEKCGNVGVVSCLCAYLFRVVKRTYSFVLFYCGEVDIKNPIPTVKIQCSSHFW